MLNFQDVNKYENLENYISEDSKMKKVSNMDHKVIKLSIKKYLSPSAIVNQGEEDSNQIKNSVRYEKQTNMGINVEKSYFNNFTQFEEKISRKIASPPKKFKFLMFKYQNFISKIPKIKEIC